MGMNKRTHDDLWPQVIDRNGHDLCIRCGDPGEVLHHVNGDDTDNRLENVDMLCRSCNKLRRLQKKNLPVSLRDYTPEHKTKTIKEPLFRKWLQGIMESNNYHYPLDLVIRQGAHDIDLSPETIKRYLSYLTDHPTSPYITKAGQFGEMDVWVKGKEPQEDIY